MNSSVTTDIVTLYTHGGIPAHIFLFADSMCSHGLPSVPMPVPNLLTVGRQNQLQRRSGIIASGYARLIWRIEFIHD